MWRQAACRSRVEPRCVDCSCFWRLVQVPTGGAVGQLQSRFGGSERRRKQAALALFLRASAQRRFFQAGVGPCQETMLLPWGEPQRGASSASCLAPSLSIHRVAVVDKLTQPCYTLPISPVACNSPAGVLSLTTTQSTTTFAWGKIRTGTASTGRCRHHSR